MVNIYIVCGYIFICGFGRDIGSAPMLLAKNGVAKPKAQVTSDGRHKSPGHCDDCKSPGHRHNTRSQRIFGERCLLSDIALKMKSLVII